MNRLTSLALLLTMLVSSLLVTPQPVLAAAPDPAPRFQRHNPIVSGASDENEGTVLEADVAPDITSSRPSLSVPVTDLGDWTNGAATACIAGFGSAFVVSYVASFIPFYGEFADPVAFAADLALKFCAPYLQPRGALVLKPSDQGNTCSYDVRLPANGTGQEQNEIVAQYSNLMGIPISPRYYMVDWGQPGRPDLYHFNTNVDLILNYPGERVDGDTVRLPVGSYDLTWRGETLVDIMDFIYIPSPGPGYTKEQVKRMSKSTILKKTLRRLIKDIVKQFYRRLSTEGKALMEEKIFQQVADLDYGDRHGVYNVEYQGLTVIDENDPTVALDATLIQLEATDPGGLTRRKAEPILRRTVHADDLCDLDPSITPLGLPSFLPVGSETPLTWRVADDGPALGGGANAVTATQTVRVVDTMPPIIVPPPSIVTETEMIPVVISATLLGRPLVFDLVDMDPQVFNDAPASFPAGVTEVHWWAVDASGNSTCQPGDAICTPVTQIINVKAPGANTTPTATGAGYDAITFEPVTVTLQADDPDQDPLWFKIEDEPQHGFFIAPLLPYFIEDYRVESKESWAEVQERCQTTSGPFQYPTVWDADWVSVSDAGVSYVIDRGSMFCQTDGHLDTYYRIAAFDQEGSLVATIGSSGDSPENVYIDDDTHTMFVTDHTSGGVGSVVLYRLPDLIRIETFRTDVADVPVGENIMSQPIDTVIDPASIMYVTDGNAIRAYLPELVPGGLANEPVMLGSILKNASDQLSSLAVDSFGNLYASGFQEDRIYKWGASTLDENGGFTPGAFVGWMGRCDYDLGSDGQPHCDEANHRSFGFSCTDATCGWDTTWGSAPGQFNDPRGIAVDPHDVLYVTDYSNLRVQRFTPDGYFAGQAKSKCDGTCFILGDFGNPEDITVNSDHFYILDNETNLLHVSETTPIQPIEDRTDAVRVAYSSDNDFADDTDSFTFTATDGLDTSAPATVNFNVARNHRPPTPRRFLTLETVEDTPQEITLQGSDPDGALDTLTFDIAEPPLHGTLSGNGPVRTYTPDPDYSGSDLFAFTVSDSTFTSEPATVTVSIDPVNDPPAITLPTELDVGLGYTLFYTATIRDPDPVATHTLSLDWGDGSPIEHEGMIEPDGSQTGPLLIQNRDGSGRLQASHIYETPGDFTLEVYIQDEKGAFDRKTTLVHVAPMADVALRVISSANPLPDLQTPTFELLVSNEMPNAGSGIQATNVVLTDTLGEMLVYSYANPSQGTCSFADETLSCQLGALQPGETVSVELGLALDIAATIGSVLNNYAEVTADQPDPATPNTDVQNIPIVADADYVVSSLTDTPDADLDDPVCRDADGTCSLRAAVQQANFTAGPQSIALADQTYVLGEPAAALRAQATAASALEIADDLTILGLGPDRTAIYGQQADRVLVVTGGVSLTVEGVALSGGTTTGNGGGLLNDGGSVVLRDVLVGNNQAANGAGLYNDGGSIVIERALFSGNRVDGDGGALHNFGGTVNLTNVTLSANEARGNGGAIYNAATVNLANVTVAGNLAEGEGGGLRNANSLNLMNTLIADNVAPTGPDCSGALTSSGTNLVQDTAGCSVGGVSSGDVLDQDARLRTLGENGGSTFSHALRLLSPAVDGGSCQEATDQRGVARPQGGECDIGAFELVTVSVYLPSMSLR
jgi:CSLREA domain-containing protein